MKSVCRGWISTNPVMSPVFPAGDAVTADLSLCSLQRHFVLGMWPRSPTQPPLFMWVLQAWFSKLSRNTTRHLKSCNKVLFLFKLTRVNLSCFLLRTLTSTLFYIICVRIKRAKSLAYLPKESLPNVWDISLVLSIAFHSGLSYKLCMSRRTIDHRKHASLMNNQALSNSG